MKLVILRIHFQSICHSIIAGTGEDDNAENEGSSPTKKAKGTPGRKGNKTTKAASKKGANQETGTDTGKR